MVEGSDRFERFDLVMTRAMHEANKKNGVYNINLPDMDIYDLRLRANGIPSYDKDLMPLLKKVGGKYNWDRRREFYENRDDILKVIESKNSRYFSFMVNGKEIGGVIVANVEPMKRLKEMYRGVSKKVESYADLTSEAAENTIEIFKIGLEDQFTGMRLGRYFFGAVLGVLFKDEVKDDPSDSNTKLVGVLDAKVTGNFDVAWPKKQPDVVYLNTRDSNHPKVPDFYKKGFNMNLINGLTYPDDLLSPEDIEKYSSKKVVQLPRSGKKPKGGASGAALEAAI